MIDIGQGLVTLGGSLVTAIGAVAVLILTNRAQFRKAQMERENMRQDAMDHAARIAIDLAKRTDDAADRLKMQAQMDSTAKGAQLTEIGHAVNSRLSEALLKISNLESKIASLESIINRLIGPGKALTTRQTDVLRQTMKGAKKPRTKP